MELTNEEKQLLEPLKEDFRKASKIIDSIMKEEQDRLKNLKKMKNIFEAVQRATSGDRASVKRHLLKVAESTPGIPELTSSFLKSLLREQELFEEMGEALNPEHYGAAAKMPEPEVPKGKLDMELRGYA